MGVVERIAQIQAEAAAKKLAEEQDTQRKLKEAEDERLQAQAFKVRRDAERRQVIISELSPILEAVKAREQLEMVKDTVWQIGEVDSEPTPILSDNEDFKKLSLRLRATYNTVESSGGEGDVTGSMYPSSDAVFIGIDAVNNGSNGIPGVWVHSGLSNRYNYNSANYLKFTEVSLEQPQAAQDKLEEMLAEACIKLGTVREFVDAREQHFKSFRFGEEARPAQTPPRKPGFFERIFGGSGKTYRSGNPPFYGGPSTGMG